MYLCIVALLVDWFATDFWIWCLWFVLLGFCAGFSVLLWIMFVVLTCGFRLCLSFIELITCWGGFVLLLLLLGFGFAG